MNREKLAQTTQKFIQRAGTWYTTLSVRERQLVIGGSLALLLFSIYYITFEKIYPSFEEQSAQLANDEDEIRKLPELISRYVELRAQLGQMESTFQVNNANLDIPSYIEGIARNFPKFERLRIAARGAATKLGQNFQQSGFMVTFASPDVPSLVQFLEKTIHGEHPLLVTRVNLQKASNTLNVSIEISHIQRISGNGAAT